MKEGRVDAVIVGADRVAANGSLKQLIDINYLSYHLSLFELLLGSMLMNLISLSRRYCEQDRNLQSCLVCKAS